jgi:hypothetical protein
MGRRGVKVMVASEEPEPGGGANGLPGLPAKEPGDLYILRGLIFCGLCAGPMLPVLIRTGIRKYGCPNKRCPRPLLPAEILEQKVWSRFTLLNEAFAGAVHRNQRNEVLRQVLKRVVVGSDMSALSFEWRD